MTYNRRNKRDGPDRRRWPRMKPADLPFIKRVEFNKGDKIEIIDISRGGLLLETESRLGPDLKIDVKIVTTEGVFRVEGKTLRSSVFSLKGGPRYRTAVIFKDPFELMDGAVDTSQQGIEEKVPEDEIYGLSEKGDGQQKNQGNCDQEKAPAVLTVVASDDSGIRLNETFTVNDW